MGTVSFPFLQTMANNPVKLASRGIKTFLWLAAAALPIAAEAANPFLPSYEYIPDGEPHVFGDRVYLYGSHDTAGSTAFCDYILKVWSAPLDDLNHWTDHGVVFSTRNVDGHPDDIPWSDNQFYAPDVAKKDGKYYLFAQIVGSPCSVAVSDHPAGPFKLISQIKAPAGAPMDFGGWAQYFDPGLLVDDDGQVYLYWGGGRSFMAQLKPETMTEILPGTYQEDIIPREEPFKFFEASSPRKIGGRYYLIYAAGADLVYAASDSPKGPFAYGGVIVSNSGDNPGGNIHGSLANLKGQWYIFYHRMTNNTVYSRRACAERVRIEADGSIRQVEQTSLGFQASLDPYEVTPADIACVLRGGSYVTELDKRTHPVMNNREGSVVGYKYYEFGEPLPGQKTIFTAQFRQGAASGRMELWLGDPAAGGEKIGVVPVEKAPALDGVWRELTIPVPNIRGRHALYLKFAGEADGGIIADLRSFVFTRDTP